MTIPTQAQIEAAARAVEEAYKCYGTEFTTIAICALTAAAEVGYGEPQGTGFQAGEAEPAAAEVEEEMLQAEVERLRAALVLFIQTVNPPYPQSMALWQEHLKAATENAKAALTAAAEVGESLWAERERAFGYNLGVAATIERCARYHDDAAIECDKIAAVNMDNKLGSDCITRAQDHREDAAAIRALKNEP